MEEQKVMPLRSSGAIENEHLRGKVNSGLIGTAKTLLTGVTPHKAVEVDGANPTSDTYQRKVFFDGTNIFIIYWESGTLKILYVASADGETWTTATLLRQLVGTIYSGGNLDIAYPNRGSKDLNGVSIDLAIYLTRVGYCLWYPYVISGQTLTAKTGAGLGAGSTPQGGSIHSNLNGTNDYALFHRNATNNYTRTHNLPTNVVDDTDTSVPFGATTSGGCQLLPYKTSSPYQMLALAKGGDNKLYYNIVTEPTATFANSFTEIATLGTGFSDFCGCSEAQNAGDPERIHLVYVKSSGELCYRKFQNDALDTETVLLETGASYPVIACGSNQKLYVFYVADGKIWLKHYNGNRWLAAVELFTSGHTYNSPVYLSSNQNVQSGKICLVWTEGTSSPYEVWFCSLED